MQARPARACWAEGLACPGEGPAPFDPDPHVRVRRCSRNAQENPLACSTMVSRPIQGTLDDLDLEADWEDAPWFQAALWLGALAGLVFGILEGLPTVVLAAPVLILTACLAAAFRQIKNLLRRINTLEERLDGDGEEQAWG